MTHLPYAHQSGNVGPSLTNGDAGRPVVRAAGFRHTTPLSPRRHKAPFSLRWSNSTPRPRKRARGPFQAETGPCWQHSAKLRATATPATLTATSAAKRQGKRRRKHQRHIAGKPRNSKRRLHAVAEHRKKARRYAQHRDQEMRQQIREILLDAQPKMVAVESLKCISMQASARGTVAAPGKNVKAKRRLNESLAEAAIGHVGKLLREEAAKLGITTISVPPQGTSQTCPRCGDRHPDNRESQAVFRCRNCGLYAHADWTAAVIIRNRAYVRHCEWQSGYTPDVLTAPTGWREQPSGSEPRQPRLGLELSVFKLEGTATSSDRNRVRGPRPACRIQAASQGAKTEADSARKPRFRGRAQFVHTL